MRPSSAPRHPHAYTLDLLKLAIDRLPPTFSAETRKVFQERLEYFKKNPDEKYESIRLTIADLGKQSWSYRKAYEETYARYGRASE